MRNRRLFVLGLGLIFLLLTSQTSACSKGKVKNDLIEISFKIDEAYYEDTDSDGKMDDIVGLFTIKARSNLNDDLKSFFNNLKVYLHLTLILPSGNSFDYLFEYKFSSGDIGDGISIHYAAYFIDHALESGWYELVVGYELVDGGYDYDDTDIVFDPPGENEGVPPPAFVEEM